MINTEQSKEMNRQRIRESNREKGEKYHAESEAERINSWSRFLFLHTGQQGLKNGVFYDVQSNRLLVEKHITNQDLPINLSTIEAAFESLTKSGSLANFPKHNYQRKSDINESRILPQQRSFAPATKIAPYTKEEILSFGPSQMRAALKKFGAAELNRILAN